MIGEKLYASADDGNVFTDILFNALLGFAFMFVIAFALIRPEPVDGKITPKAEFLITAQWPDHHPDDVDLIVEDPQGNLAWFDGREAGLMHLERDDRGRLGDQMNVNGTQMENPINQETVTLRGFMAGEYVVNLLHYKAETGRPVTVKVKLEKLNPVLSIAYAGEIVLTGAGDEKTAFRFDLDSEGAVHNIFTRHKTLLRMPQKAGAP